MKSFVDDYFYNYIKRVSYKQTMIAIVEGSPRRENMKKYNYVLFLLIGENSWIRRSNGFIVGLASVSRLYIGDIVPNSQFQTNSAFRRNGRLF